MSFNLLNIRRSPKDERDWKASAFLPQGQDLPEYLDLRNDLQPVRDQGTQGSCVAMSASCMKEWQEKKDTKFDGYLSPQFIYNLREDVNSPGMYPRDLMRILTKHGVCPEDDYPYGSTETITDSVFKKASNFRIKGYAQVEDIETLKTALATNGVCIIAVPVYNYGSRIWSKDRGDTDLLGGHAMAVVGYNSEGFLIRNSWGFYWESDGYTIFPYEDWDWGVWEAWTTIDEKSVKELPKRSWWRKIIDAMKYILGESWPSLDY